MAPESWDMQLNHFDSGRICLMTCLALKKGWGLLAMNLLITE